MRSAKRLLCSRAWITFSHLSFHWDDWFTRVCFGKNLPIVECRRAWESLQQQWVGMMPIVRYLVKYLQHYKRHKLRLLGKKKKRRKRPKRKKHVGLAQDLQTSLLLSLYYFQLHPSTQSRRSDMQGCCFLSAVQTCCTTQQGWRLSSIASGGQTPMQPRKPSSVSRS